MFLAVTSKDSDVKQGMGKRAMRVTLRLFWTEVSAKVATGYQADNRLLISHLN